MTTVANHVDIQQNVDNSSYALCKYNRIVAVLVLNELLQYVMIEVIVIKYFWVSNLQWVLTRCITLQ